MLEDLEDEKFQDVDFIELNACSGGCVGGVLNVENPYVAKTKLKRIRKNLPVSLNNVKEDDMSYDDVINWDTSLEYVPVMNLDDNMEIALEKMAEIQKITDKLEGLDCGACGAPSCRALAEDVVRGLASTDDCIYNFNSNIQNLIKDMQKLEDYIPRTFRETEKENSSNDTD